MNQNKIWSSRNRISETNPHTRVVLTQKRNVAACAAFLLAGCGILDVYKSHDKKCKTLCKDDDTTAPKAAPPFNFDLNFWNQSTPRSQLNTNTELVPLLRSNPFKLLSTALKTASEDISSANKVTQTQTTQATCLKEVFAAPVNRSNDTLNVSLDYGRCVDRAQLEQRTNANRNTAQEGSIRVLEIGSAFKLTSNGQLSLSAGGDAILDANTGLDLLSILPFRSVRATELTAPSQAQLIKFNLIRGTEQGTAIEKTGAVPVLKKSWGLLYVGLDENQPFVVNWLPQSNTIRLTGSLATLNAAFQRPTNQKEWNSFGYTREFIFQDFRLTAPSLELNSQLGWSEQTILSGSYFLRINGDLIEPGGPESKLFHMKALDRPCSLDVSLVTGWQGENPIEQPIGQISICGS